MLTMNSHGVEISIAGGVEEMVRAPHRMLPRCSYIPVLPSTLTLCYSYSDDPRRMTHCESYCEIPQLTRTSQLRHISQPIKTDKTIHMPIKGSHARNP